MLDKQYYTRKCKATQYKSTKKIQLKTFQHQSNATTENLYTNKTKTKDNTANK